MKYFSSPKDAADYIKSNANRCVGIKSTVSDELLELWVSESVGNSKQKDEDKFQLTFEKKDSVATLGCLTVAISLFVFIILGCTGLFMLINFLDNNPGFHI